MSKDIGRPFESWTKLDIFLAAIALFIAGAVIYILYFKPSPVPVDPVTLCGDQASARAILMLVDASDSLAAASIDRFAVMVADDAKSLALGSRLVLATFDGAVNPRFRTFFDRCSPGRAGEVKGVPSLKQNAIWKRDFLDHLAPAAKSAAASAKGGNPTSHIAEAISAAVRDNSLHFAGTKRRLVVFTDGLQHSDSSRPYRSRRINLPDPHPRLLDGIDLVLVELAPVPTGSGIQSEQSRRAWQTWAREAGADSVDIQAPGVVNDVHPVAPGTRSSTGVAPPGFVVGDQP